MRTGWRGRAWLGAGVALAGLMLGVWLTPVTVRQVSVTGTEKLARTEVARLAGVALGTRMTYGQACRVEAALGRHPAFSRVSVTRGLTGTLHVRVTERVPAVWCPRTGCALAVDGIALPHFNRREAGWVGVDGFETAKGVVTDRAAFAEALELAGLIAALGIGDAGLIRRTPAEGWEWSAAGKRIRFSSPLVPAEFGRLGRFREAYPAAWAGAGRLDLRFRDRLVMKP
ncbi:MAG: FtsQ-type POTRA domain-containing protein [Candidatus Coatesbacteria bacterium]